MTIPQRLSKILRATLSSHIHTYLKHGPHGFYAEMTLQKYKYKACAMNRVNEYYMLRAACCVLRVACCVLRCVALRGCCVYRDCLMMLWWYCRLALGGYE